MKVLVLGGTGAMGTHLVQLLSSSGIETVVTSRTQRSSIRNVRYVTGNAQEIIFLQTILEENWDVIVDFMVYTTASFRERVYLLLKATSQYVFMSSARVYADSVLPISETSSRLLDVSENKEYLATDEYALTKARQEDILKNTGYRNWTIIRPYITYSENRLQLGVLEKEEWLYRALKGRTIVFSRDINKKKTTLTYGLDVAKGIVAVIGNSKALEETFHITAKDFHAWSDVLAIYLRVLEKHLGYEPKVLLQDFESFLESRQKKYQVIYDRLFDRQFDNMKINEHINTGDFTKTEPGLIHCIEEFLKSPEFKSIDWKLEALNDRKSREYTPLSEIKGAKQKIRYFIFRYLAWIR